MGLLIFFAVCCLLAALGYRYRQLWLGPIRGLPTGSAAKATGTATVLRRKLGDISKDEINMFVWDLERSDSPVAELHRESGNDDGMAGV